MSEIFNLIGKDLRLCKNIGSILLIIAIIIPIELINFVVHIPLVNSIVHVMNIFFCGYTLVVGIRQMDVKNKSNMFLYSLPINRKDIVIGKYISTLVIFLMCYLVVFIISLIIFFIGKHYNLNGSVCTIKELIMVFTMVSVYYSIYYPCSFKFSEKKMALYDRYIFFVILTSPSIMNVLDKKGYINMSYFLKSFNIIKNNILVSTFIIGVIMMCLSIKISQILVSKKDINYD